jgi:hypothetical protein
MIEWRKIPKEYLFFCIDGEDVCRFSVGKPEFNADGRALFDWKGLKPSKFVYHEQILAEYFKGVDLDAIKEYYPRQTVLQRRNT